VPDGPGGSRAALAALAAGLLDRGVPTYVIASNVEIARASLGDPLNARMRTTRITPLRDRRAEIASLLSGMLRWRGHPYTAPQFAPNLPALERMPMAGNFDELRFAVDAMIALATMGFNDAADYMKKPRDSFYDWRKRWRLIDLTLTPVPRADETDQDEPPRVDTGPPETLESNDEP
jgi:hypothetical protein